MKDKATDHDDHLIGYARVSTSGQDLALQVDALQSAGCERIYRDVGSGSIRRRPELDNCLDYLRQGDTLVAWRLDRLGRSLRHLLELVAGLQERHIAFRSLKENIDTSTATGRLFFHLVGALAEFERELIRERSAAGREAARARGRHGGRPRLLTPDKLAATIAMRAQGQLTMAQIARRPGGGTLDPLPAPGSQPGTRRNSTSVGVAPVAQGKDQRTRARRLAAAVVLAPAFTR